VEIRFLRNSKATEGSYGALSVNFAQRGGRLSQTVESPTLFSLVKNPGYLQCCSLRLCQLLSGSLPRIMQRQHFCLG
jgi:hypothetical protein